MKFEQHDVEWTHDKIGRFWDYISENRAYNKQFFGLRSGRHVARLINNTLKFKTFDRILDMSCGKGDVLEACLTYLQSGQYAYGTDFSDKNVEYVNEKFKDSSFFKEARSLQSYPSCYSTEFFDLVIITEVVEHLSDQDLDSMLKESNRLLAPGGYICITTPNSEDLEANKVMCPDCGCMFHRWQHLRSWTPNLLQDTLEKYSFKPVFVKPMEWSGSFKRGLLMNLAIKMNLMSPRGLVFIGKKR